MDGSNEIVKGGREANLAQRLCIAEHVEIYKKIVEVRSVTKGRKSQKKDMR